MSTLRKVNIKNCRHYYPDDMISVEDLDLNKVLVYERQYEKNIFIYRVACKTSYNEKKFAQ